MTEIEDLKKKTISMTVICFLMCVTTYISVFIFYQEKTGLNLGHAVVVSGLFISSLMIFFFLKERNLLEKMNYYKAKYVVLMQDYAVDWMREFEFYDDALEYFNDKVKQYPEISWYIVEVLKEKEVK